VEGLSLDRPERTGTLARVAEVGDSARRSRVVTTRDIELFTELSGDRNPLHYDEAAAAKTRFGGIVVREASRRGS
jgi:acyl dehydratase